MNEARLKEIAALVGKIDDLKSQVETVRDAEQEYYDNMPENLQGSEAGERAESAASSLDDAVNNLSEAMDALEGL
jgi:hypothetical protein